jgi:hypothetical protein
VLHAATYKDARDSILDALTYAGAVEPDDAHDPDATPTEPAGELDADEPPWEPAS